MAKNVTHKVVVEATKSPNWIRLRGGDNPKVSAMFPPEALPEGADPGATVSLTVTTK